jgi:hypothetical protein
MRRKRIHIYQLAPSNHDSDVLPVVAAGLPNLNTFQRALAPQSQNIRQTRFKQFDIVCYRMPALVEMRQPFSRTKSRQVVGCTIGE